MFDEHTRSRIMSTVRTAHTDPEVRLGKLLRLVGVPVSAQATRLPGSPDFVVRPSKLAIFVDGDFWHGREWFAVGAAPVTNRDFWIAKFEKNRARDRRADRKLRRLGWSVLHVWASDIRRRPEAVIRRVIRAVTSR